MQSWDWSGDGVVLRADATWHTLKLELDGRHSLTTECLRSVLWGFVENEAIPPTMGQFNFMTEVGEWMTIETFYNGGTRMNIESMADFVRAQ